MGLVVCGGSALIASGLRQRTTNDADVVAMLSSTGELLIPIHCRPFFWKPAHKWRAIWGCKKTGSTMDRAAMTADYSRWGCRLDLPAA